VKLEEDPEAKMKFYKERKVPSTVEIATKGGRRLVKHVEYPKGEPRNAFAQEDHDHKHANMASSLGMKQNQFAQLAEAINKFEALKNVNELTRLLVP
jgi:2-methylcitrate dehydratase PrpD